MLSLRKRTPQQPWPWSNPQQQPTDRNTKSRRIQKTSGLPARAGATREIADVDDGGQFSYYRSEQDLLAAFEYVEDAACIIDRRGTACRLALDQHRHLILGPSRGLVEYHWLRHAWLDAETRTRKGTGYGRFRPSPGKN